MSSPPPLGDATSAVEMNTTMAADTIPNATSSSSGGGDLAQGCPKYGPNDDVRTADDRNGKDTKLMLYFHRSSTSPWSPSGARASSSAS